MTRANVTVELSPEAYMVLCGLAAPSEVVNSDGIFAGAAIWEEIRDAFPAEDFPQNPSDGIDIDYDEEAGY